MRNYLFCITLLALALPAKAENNAPADAGCETMNCIISPIYKLGKEFLFGPEPQALPPEPAQSPSDTGTRPPEAFGDTHEIISADHDDKRKVAAVASGDARRHDHAKPDHKRKIIRTFASYGGSAQKRRPAYQPAGHKLAERQISIFVDGPNEQRMAAMVGILGDPSIRLTPSPIDDCTGRPVEFTVDTLTSSSRRGPAIPLFEDRLLVITRVDISSINALKGRKLSFGLAGGPSEDVGRRLLTRLGVIGVEVSLDFDNAVDALLLGEIDGLLVLAPRGYDRLAAFGNRLRLLAVPDGLTDVEGAKITRVTPASYLGSSWSNVPIRMLSVEAVLSPNPALSQQDAPSSVYTALDRHSTQLSQNGFDLIGSGAIMTMRSVAEEVGRDPAPIVARRASSDCKSGHGK